MYKKIKEKKTRARKTTERSCFQIKVFETEGKTHRRE